MVGSDFGISHTAVRHVSTSPHIHQMAPTCNVGTLALLGEYDWTMLPAADQSPQPKKSKLIGSAILAQLAPECCRVHSRHLANTIEIVHIDITLPVRLNCASFVPPESTA